MDVLRVKDLVWADLQALLDCYHLRWMFVPDEAGIPGSFWGDDEAGLLGLELYVRLDTPVHSLLHEACHFICMSTDRRLLLDTNAGGEDIEENAVCYLQILLADYLRPMSRARMFADMDAWGYSFRLGSAQRWFEEDAEDARDWLLAHALIDEQETPLWRLRR